MAAARASRWVECLLLRYVAGLQIVEPGYRMFRVAPHPGGGITSAHTHHDSPNNRIEVAWRVDKDRGELHVTVPDGTSARFDLPDGTSHLAEPGTHHHTWAVEH